MGLLTWILFSLSDGYRDGGAFSWTDERYPEGFDVHHYFLPDRGVKLVTSLGIDYFTGIRWWLLPLITLAYVLIFSWFHNGMMHRVRGRQDVSGRNWKSHSDTTTAKISFTYWERSFQLFIGLLIYASALVIEYQHF